MGQIKIVVKKERPYPKYIEGFKRQVVREYEQGLLNKDQLMEKYGIKGKSRVLTWCLKYGRFAYNTPAQNGRPMKDPQKQRIKELEKKLKEADMLKKSRPGCPRVGNRKRDKPLRCMPSDWL